MSTTSSTRSRAHPTAARFREAVERRDIDAARELLAEDIVFHSPVTFHPFLGRDTVALRQDELDRLLRALATLDDEAAGTIAEEISALRVAGVRLHLMPTEAELKALRAAIRVAEPVMRTSGSGLARLLPLCGE